ncbi:MAG TPA: radical SAM protein, partial [Longimicrobium sp.]|nr:radical SAM protein [Longimicrobium sp.]
MTRIIAIPEDFRETLSAHGLRPTDLVLYINSACNLRCKHCYVGSSLLDAATRYRAGEVNGFVNSFERLDRITILGGEPLLHREIDSIVANIDARGVGEFRITTNLTSFGAFRYRTHRGRALTLCVSLDGHHAPVHDHIRGEGNFARTVRNIETLVEHGFDIEITHTVTSVNLPHFERMVELCERLGVKHLNLHCMSLHGNAIDNPELRIAPAEWVRFRESLAARSRPGGKNERKLAIRYPVLYVTPDEYERLVRTGEYHHHAAGSYYGSGDRVILYADGKIYVSSEAF